MPMPLRSASLNYDTPEGRRIATEEADIELWRWQMWAVRYRRSTAEGLNRESIAASVMAWRGALGMDRYDNIAAK